MKKLLLINCLILCSFVSYAENQDVITDLKNNGVVTAIENELQNGISARNDGKASGVHLFNNVKTMSHTKVVYKNESNLESKVIEPKELPTGTVQASENIPEPKDQLTEAVQALEKLPEPNDLESAYSSNEAETNNSMNQEVNTVATQSSDVTLDKGTINNQLPMKNPSETAEGNSQFVQPKSDGKDSESVTSNQDTTSEESKKCLALLQGFKEKYDGDCLNNLPNGMGIAEGINPTPIYS